MPTRRPAAARRATLGALLAGATLLGSCGTSGRELRDVPVGQTAPPRTEQAGASASSAGASTTASGPAALVLTAADFAGGEGMPASLSCDGEGTSPALSWTGLPADTAELALTVTDVDDDGAVHWAVTAIPPTAVGAPRGSAPDDAIVHTNADGDPAYLPVCPPEGEAHTYELSLYALTEPLALDDTATGDDVVAALGARSAAGTASRTLLVGTYER